MILADTHTLLWLWTGETRLGRGARRVIDDALGDRELAVSAITFWEVAMLREKGRLIFPEDVGLWRRELLAQGMVEIPINGEIATRAGFLAGIHGDPADRIIIATALEGHTLITGDQTILDWHGHLNRLDARE